MNFDEGPAELAICHCYPFFLFIDALVCIETGSLSVKCSQFFEYNRGYGKVNEVEEPGKRHPFFPLSYTLTSGPSSFFVKDRSCTFRAFLVFCAKPCGVGPGAFQQSAVIAMAGEIEGSHGISELAMAAVMQGAGVRDRDR